jgi:hypothetical protein
MGSGEQPDIIAARAFRSVTLIDGGDTLAIELEGSAGQPLHVLIPAVYSLDLGSQVMVEAANAAKLRGNRSSNRRRQTFSDTQG